MPFLAWVVSNGAEDAHVVRELRRGLELTEGCKDFRELRVRLHALDAAEGERPRLRRGRHGTAIVRAYTDLKRHNLCDDPADPDPIRYFCNEQLAQGRPDQDGRPGTEFFLTRKLWDVGNTAPYGHRGDVSTIWEAIARFQINA